MADIWRQWRKVEANEVAGATKRVRKSISQFQRQSKQTREEVKASECAQSAGALIATLAETGGMVRVDEKIVAMKLRQLMRTKLEREMIEAALWWRKFVERRFGNDYSIGESQVKFFGFNASSPRHVAFYRTVLELRANHPDFKITAEDKEPCGFLGSPDAIAPSLQFIRDVQKRYDAYLKARERAADELRRLILPASLESTARLISPSTCAPIITDNKQRAIEQKNTKAVRALTNCIEKLMLEANPSPTRGDTKDVWTIPDHIRIAVLVAMGIIHPDSMKLFQTETFWQLDEAEQTKFLHLCKNPQLIKLGRELCPGLRSWLWDNMPIFEHYSWRWEAIREAAIAAGLLSAGARNEREPGANLRQLFYEMKRDVQESLGLKVCVNLPAGRARAATKTAQPRVELLTPPPKIKIPVIK